MLLGIEQCVTIEELVAMCQTGLAAPAKGPCLPQQSYSIGTTCTATQSTMKAPSGQSPETRPTKPPAPFSLLPRTHLVRHVALGAGNVLHDVAEAHLQGVRLLLEQLVALLGTDALGL